MLAGEDHLGQALQKHQVLINFFICHIIDAQNFWGNKFEAHNIKSKGNVVDKIVFAWLVFRWELCQQPVDQIEPWKVWNSNVFRHGVEVVKQLLTLSNDATL